jgi:probable phosphoglycerate mutase
VTRTISGHSATPLTELGREQAETLGKRLKGMDTTIDFVYSSDLERAAETSAIMCSQLGIEEIHYDERLREGNAGIFTGRQVDTLTEEERAIFDNIIVDLDSRIPGGESANEQYHRTKQVFLEIIEKHLEESTILIVGHGGTLFHILYGTLELIPFKMDEWFGNCQLQVLERTSAHTLWRLIMFNNRPL